MRLRLGVWGLATGEGFRLWGLGLLAFGLRVFGGVMDGRCGAFGVQILGPECLLSVLGSGVSRAQTPQVETLK